MQRLAKMLVWRMTFEYLGDPGSVATAADRKGGRENLLRIQPVLQRSRLFVRHEHGISRANMWVKADPGKL